MVNPVSSNSTQAQWQALQATQAARSAGAVSPVSPVSAVPTEKAAPVRSRFDTLEISQEGRSYAASQAAASASKSADNAALLKKLNTADSSGLSYIQQQTAFLKAGISASSLMGTSNTGSFGGGSFSSLDMSSLMDSYTQSKQTHTILRNAGISALGIQNLKPSGSTDGSGNGEDGESSLDLSGYSLGDLSKLLSNGSITTEQYLAEGANRQQQKQADASSNNSAVSAAVGAVTQ